VLFLSDIRKRFSKGKQPGLGRVRIDNERIDLTNSNDQQKTQKLEEMSPVFVESMNIRL
jgi:hypothetical protein